MDIRKLLNNDEYTLLVGKDDEFEKVMETFDIEEISFDSRIDGNGKIFFASTGASSDGSEYINAAIGNNYKIIVTDKDKETLVSKYEVSEDIKDVFILKVADVNEMMAIAAERMQDAPSSNMKMIGVTGTNGKTTITSLIFECLKAFDKKVGLIGTMEIHYDDEIEVSQNTTPDSPKLQKVYKKMVDKGCEYNIMEVSSHSLALKRICTEKYEVGVYTNLTEDHLDYHKTMESYRDAKNLMFKKSKNCVINMDTEYSDFYINDILKDNKNCMIYARCNKEKMDDVLSYISDIRKKYESENLSILLATNEEIDLSGSKFRCVYTMPSGEIIKEDIKVKTPGEFSIYNTLAAIGTLLYLGRNMNEVAEVLKSLDGIKGRFQTFNSNKGFSVIVDYAHTPDGLYNILKTAQKFAKGRIITVFGCGGNRDKKKRPIMGKIAMDNSDIAIVTSDNPRFEDPDEIIADVEVGMQDTNKEYIKITDRLEATKKAIDIARKDDIVILAGKGHEDYQIIGNKKIHLSDIENVLELINKNEK